MRPGLVIATAPGRGMGMLPAQQCPTGTPEAIAAIY
jgi:hypothetical protein